MLELGMTLIAVGLLLHIAGLMRTVRRLRKERDGLRSKIILIQDVVTRSRIASLSNGTEVLILARLRGEIREIILVGKVL